MEKMTLVDEKSFLNNVKFSLEDLIHHEKTFLKICNIEIKKEDLNAKHEKLTAWAGDT